ncbi:MAG: hypothetical protein QOH71_2928 [Blastocatellia bacterium]|jgi:hypothetical protein|nr:hypothetical protein [Blastocatellia bacterium]
MERGHPVRLSAKREQSLNEDTPMLNGLRTLADKMFGLHYRSRYRPYCLSRGSPETRPPAANCGRFLFELELGKH